MLCKVKYFFILSLFITTISYSQITVTLPTVSGLPNTTKVVPINVSNISMNDAVTSYQFQLNYNKNSIYITALSVAGTITTGGVTSKIDTANGIVRVGWATATPISGTGALLNLTIKFRESGSSVLDFGNDINTRFMFNSGTPAVNVVTGLASVSTVNQPPVFDLVPPKSTKEGKNVSFNVNATDPEGAAVTFTTGTLPLGAQFTPATKSFSWTPTFTQAAIYFIDFFANDGNSSSKLTVTIEVADSNSAPIITDISEKTIAEGQTLTFVVSAVDLENDPMTFSTSALLPGASFNPTTKIFTWTPSYSQAGSYAIIIFVSDGVNSSQKIVLINVTDANQKPVFKNVLGTKTIDVDIPAVEFSFQYTAEDGDGDNLIFSLLNGPTGATISSTGLFKWKPQAADAEKEFQVVVTVSDGKLTATDNSTLKTGKIVSVESESGIPTKFELYQNYPNPFNPSTIIKYAVPAESHVTIKVFDLLGTEISTLVNTNKGSGNYQTTFTAKDLRTGVYFLQMKANNFIKTQKMMLIQ